MTSCPSPFQDSQFSMLETYRNQPARPALWITLQTKEGHCLGVWDTLWDTEEHLGLHRAYYGMLMEEIKGLKMEGFK